MPRYEFSEGTSNKFWEIKIDGTEVITTYGRIGSEGKSTSKSYSSAAEAKKEYNKLIASKTQKGYEPVSGAPSASAKKGPVAVEPRNPELEAALVEDPNDNEAYLVYADWLQTKGHPRGELITLQHALKKAAGDEQKRLRAAEKKMFKEHADLFFPEKLAGMLGKGDGECLCEVSWQNGYICKAQLSCSYDDEDEDGACTLEELVVDLLSHPSARFLQELKIGPLGIADEYDYSDIASAVVKAKHPALRSLYFASFEQDHSEISWSHLGHIGKLIAALPKLEHLTLHGGDMDLGTIDAPNLRSFRVETGGFTEDNIKSVCKAKWPNLESLHIYFGDENYGAGGDVDSISPILEGKGLPRLKHLGLMNAEFTNEICKALPSAKIVSQLESLDLSLGTMSDEGAAALVENKNALKQIKKLDVSENFLTKTGIKAVQGLCAEVKTAAQKEPYDWADTEEGNRYVSVAE